MIKILMLTLLFSGLSYSDQKKGIELYDSGKFDEAKLQFEQSISDKETKPKALMYLARIALKKKDIDEAEELIEEAEELAPKDAEIQFYYGIVNGEIAQEASIFTALGYAKKTRKAFAKAVVLEPDSIAYRQALMSYHIAAPGIAGGDKEVALEQAKAIKVLDLKKGLMALARVYAADEDEDAIDDLYTSLPESLRFDPEILIQKAFYLQRKENFKEATAVFKLVVKHAADNKEFQNSKFHATYQIGRSSVLSEANLDEGIEKLNSFIDKAPAGDGLPSLDWAKFRLANLIELKGDKKQARSIYKQLKKITKDKSLIKAIKKAL